MVTSESVGRERSQFGFGVWRLGGIRFGRRRVAVLQRSHVHGEAISIVGEPLQFEQILLKFSQHLQIALQSVELRRCLGQLSRSLREFSGFLRQRHVSGLL
jgi:hypothetical protein